jgi:hypothetical protein
LSIKSSLEAITEEVDISAEIFCLDVLTGSQPQLPHDDILGNCYCRHSAPRLLGQTGVATREGRGGTTTLGPTPRRRTGQNRRREGPRHCRTEGLWARWKHTSLQGARGGTASDRDKGRYGLVCANSSRRWRAAVVRKTHRGNWCRMCDWKYIQTLPCKLFSATQRSSMSSWGGLICAQRS